MFYEVELPLDVKFMEEMNLTEALGLKDDGTMAMFQRGKYNEPETIANIANAKEEHKNLIMSAKLMQTAIFNAILFLETVSCALFAPDKEDKAKAFQDVLLAGCGPYNMLLRALALSHMGIAKKEEWEKKSIKDMAEALAGEGIHGEVKGNA